MNQAQYIINHTSIPSKSIENTLQLLKEGATVPFIARYRKEASNGLDEVQITAIRDFSKKYDELIARQQTILNSIEEQDKLTAELKLKIEDFKKKEQQVLCTVTEINDVAKKIMQNYAN